MMLCLIAAVVLQADPKYDINGLQIEGRVQKPMVFAVVTPPRALGLVRQPPKVVAAAELGTGAGDRLLIARARIVDARDASLAALSKWDEGLACFQAGTCPDPGEPPSADYRSALSLLEEIKLASGAEARETERLALVGYVTHEPGPAHDPERGRAALSALARREARGELAQWARLMLADRAFEQVAMAEARRWFTEAIAADPQSGIAPYCRYKLAWVHVNLDDAAAAITLLQALVAEGGPLQPEAEHTLALVYSARAELVDQAITFFARQARATQLLLGLAQGYADVGRVGPASRVLDALAKRPLAAEEQLRVDALRAELRAR